MNKICIIEDDLGIAKSLKLYLENSDFQIELFHTWDGAKEFIVSQNPDLVILDVNLPVFDGIQICQSLRETSRIPVIMLTARSAEGDKIIGLDSWADDYVSKPFSPRELLARINSLLRRTQEKPESLQESYTYENLEIFPSKNIVKLRGEELALTKNEYDLLEKIWLAEGELVTREELMHEVIGYDNYLYDRTIDTHIKNLRKKLENKDMILTIRGKWYRLNV